LTGRIIK